MGIPIDSLPPKARQQVAQKMLQNMKNSPSPETGKSKYGNKKDVRVIDGREIVFDSRKEARRFDELILRYRAGDIRDLRLQPEFTLRETYTTPEGFKIRAMRYRADFSYEERVRPLQSGGEESWKKVVEDVKSEATRTRVYEMKKKLLIERHGVIVREI